MDGGERSNSMALFDRLNDLAKNITEKTSEVIETGRISSRVSTEKNLAGEELKKIGGYYYQLYASGGEVAAEVTEFCAAAKAHYDAAAEAQAEIDRIRAENEAARAAAQAEPAADTPAGAVCPGCGRENAAGTKFCAHCGTKMETEAPAGNFCPQCGAAVSGARFCGSCGASLNG